MRRRTSAPRVGEREPYFEKKEIRVPAPLMRRCTGCGQHRGILGGHFRGTRFYCKSCSDSTGEKK